MQAYIAAMPGWKPDVGRRLDALIVRTVPGVRRGTSLRPVPPGESKSKDTRYRDIHGDDQLDETRLAAWVK